MFDLTRRLAGLSPAKRDLLLAHLHQRREAVADVPTVVPDPENRHEPFPLTEIQEAYWTGRSGLFSLGANGTNVFMQFEVEGDCDEGLRRLQHALRRMTERHEILRAEVSDGAQRIRPEVPICRIPCTDLRGLREEEIQAEIEAEARRLCYRRAEPDRWPLFESAAQRLDDRRLRFHIRIDSLLIDGESRNRLVRELFALFADPNADLPMVDLSFRDVVLAMRAWRQSTAWQRSERYWLERLDGLPPAPQLPVIAVPGPSSRFELTTHLVTLMDRADWTGLKQRLAADGLTPSALVTTVFASVLARWCMSPRFTLAMVGSHRPLVHPRIHDLVGNFNEITLLDAGEPADTFAGQVFQTRERINRDLEHRDASGFWVLRQLNRRRGLSIAPRFPVWFNSVIEYGHTTYRPTVGQRSVKCDIGTLRIVDLTFSAAQALLVPTIGESPEGDLRCSWKVVESAFPPRMSQAILEAMTALLRLLVEDPGSWRKPAGDLVAEMPGNRPSAVPRGLRALVADAWREVLSCETVPSGCASFFDLGGDSVALVRLAERVRKATGDLPPWPVLLRGDFEELVQSCEELATR